MLQEAVGTRAVVELRGLTKRFRAVTAVDGLDLVVPAGARVGVRPWP